MASSSSRQNSRFSTLKVFKFGGSAAKPPPPPPKDPYYLPNHSLASLHQTPPPMLSPPSQTRPTTPASATPLSAGYASSARSPSPTSSYHMINYAPNFAASRTTLAPSSGSILSPEPISEPGSSRKGFFKFASLGKRPKTPRSASSTSTHSSEPPSDTAEDPGISRPWNFQHNVHVDEAFTGLPPTWSASLAEMGFSEEEIANIQARRAASKTTLYALRPERPDSPASSMYSARSRTAPPLQPPARRDFDNASQRSHSSYATDISRNMSTSSAADTALSDDTSSVYTAPRRLVQSPETTYASPGQFPYPPETVPVPQMTMPSKDSRPQQPTKRTYHVVNDSVSTISPPPAYTSPHSDSPLTFLPEKSKPLSNVMDASPSIVEEQDEEVEDKGMEREEEVQEETEDVAGDSERTFKLPPRLSLHQDTLGDLSSWTESLFSIIPTPPDKPVDATLSSAEPASSSSKGTPNTVSIPPRTAASMRMSTVSARHRQLPPQKPLPAHILPGGQSTPTSPTPPPPLPPPPSAPASTDLWDELYGMVRTPDKDAHSSPKSSPGQETPENLSAPGVDSRPSSSELKVEFTRDNRDSNLSTMTVTPATIVRNVSVVKRTRANIIKAPPRSDSLSSMARSAESEETDDKESARSRRSASPVSSDSNDSDASSTGVSITSSSEPISSPSSRPTTLTVGEAQKWKGSDIKSASIPYVETSPQPSPLTGEFNHSQIITQATVRNFRESEEASGIMQRPSILIDDMPVPDGASSGSPWSAMTPSPATPALRYAGWVTEVVSPIKEFIDDTVDPRDLYADLQEVAEGESGSVFAARVVRSANAQEYVAIKQVALLPSGSQKLVDLERELRLMKNLRHPNILSMNMLYVDLMDDALWISMELMDRSLADVLNLVEEGVQMDERHIARFAKDTLTALSFLQRQGIAHRDVRSDNLLVNHSGDVKLADFSNAVKVLPNQPLCDEPAGVIYWQAPEMRSGPYDPLKVDVWSLGATVWEMAQAQPPFADATDASEIGDTLPPLDSPESFSRSFHDFLQLCSQPRTSRPDPEDLLNTPFIRNANDRSVVAELLSRCRSAEEDQAKRHSVASQGTVCP